MNGSEFGLNDKTVAMMRSVFERHPRVQEVRIFGSRAMGNFRNESDIDLVLFGDVDEKLAARIEGELDELPLPYSFDVQSYSCIRHIPLREHIDRVGRRFFVRGDAVNQRPSRPVDHR